MLATNRSLSSVVVLGAAIAAIAGYLIGVQGGGSSGAAHATFPTAQLRPTSAAGVLLEAPADWRAPTTSPAIPGLSLLRPAALAPAGESTKAGLIAGELPGGE